MAPFSTKQGEIAPNGAKNASNQHRFSTAAFRHYSTITPTAPLHRGNFHKLSAELDLDKASDLFLGEQVGTLADNCAVNGDLLYRRCRAAVLIYDCHGLAV